MRVISNSPSETIKLGKRIARFLKKGDIIFLLGELGSGKTTFVKGLAEGLVVRHKMINSPSFVLIKEFKGRLPLFHFDLYRIKSLKEIFSLGLEEYLFDEGISVIEWADRLKGLSLDTYLKIEFSIKGRMKRLIRISGFGQRFKNLIGGYENISH